MVEYGNINLGIVQDKVLSQFNGVYSVMYENVMYGVYSVMYEKGRKG